MNRKKIACFLRTLCLRLFYRLPRLPYGFATSHFPELSLGERPGRAADAPLHLWPKVHHKYITYRNARSDLRTTWEPSRFSWVRPPEDFPDAFRAWTKANPVGLGPNWSSSLEVAVRAINWAFLLEEAGDLVCPETKREVLCWLVAHGRHLSANPEPHPPNHALGRTLGLFVLGGYLRGLPEANEWFRAGHDEFCAKFPEVFSPDGTYAEGAPGYGAFVLEMGLIYLALAREWGLDSVEVPSAIQRGLGFLFNLTWPDGSLPIIGDFDDGGVLRPRENNYPRFLFELAGSLGLEFSSLATTKHYPDGGFLIIRRESLHLAAKVDDDPGLAGGHRHSDIGSFALWLREPLVIDPGVYLYTGPSSLREELRSETAHNLCWLEGKPMHIRDPQKPFTLEGRKKALFSGWEGDNFVLRHDLFGPLLERRFTLLESGLAIEDSVSEPGPWRAGFTLAPNLIPELHGQDFAIRGKRGVYSLRMEEGRGTWSTESAVFCPRYGEKQETVRLVFRPETRRWRVGFALS